MTGATSPNVICPRCAGEYVAEVKFCPRDGTPLGATAAAMKAAPMRCPKCGTEVAGARFCPKDGTKMEEVTA